MWKEAKKNPISKEKTKKQTGRPCSGTRYLIHFVALCDIMKMLIPSTANFSTEQAKEVNDGFRGDFSEKMKMFIIGIIS